MTKKLLTLLLVCLTMPAFAQQWAPKQVLVQLNHGAPVENFIASFNRSSGMYVTGVEKVSASWNIWLVKTTGDEQLGLTKVFDMPNVQQAQLNHYLKQRSVTPNDTMFFMQWNLQNIGQSGGVPGADLQMTDAWDYSAGGLSALGDTIVVAVIDAGFDITHPDIDFWKNHSEIPGDSMDNDANGYLDDYDGWNGHTMTGQIVSSYHGTHIAGIIGAKGNNVQGIAGINWNVKIMPVLASSYTDAEVMRSYSYIFDARKTYDQSNGTAGAFVVATNSSFGVDFANPANYPMWCALYDSMGRLGILSAGATSNSNVDVDGNFDMPTSCSSDFLITVTSTTRNDEKGSVCGYGATTVDMGAPGGGVFSTIPGNSYGQSSGTSMAAPHVAGAVALMIAAGCDSFMYAYRANPDSVALKLKEILIETTDTLPTLLGITVSGGRLNVYKAIRRMWNEFCVSCVKVDVVAANIACFGDSSGSIELQVSEGIPPYVIAWSTGDSAALQLINLAPGAYSAEVTDSLNCSKTVYVDIIEPAELQAGFTVTRETNTLGNGAIHATVIGGVPPYTFLWSDSLSGTTEDLTDLSAGTYSVVITDSNGCSIADTILVQRDTTNGTNHLPETPVKVYPNPSNGMFTLELPQSLAGAELLIRDVTGRLICNYTLAGLKNQVSLEGYNRGVYFLKIKKGKVEVSKKMVVL